MQNNSMNPYIFNLQQLCRNNKYLRQIIIRRADVNFDRALYPCAAVSAAAKAQKVSLDRRKLLEECGGEKRAAVDKLVKEITEAVEKHDSEASKSKGERSKKSVVETIMERVSDSTQ